MFAQRLVCDVHSSYIYNSPKLEATQMPISWGVNENCGMSIDCNAVQQ